MHIFLMITFLISSFNVYTSDRSPRPRRPEHQLMRELASLCLGLETMLLDYENRLNLECARNRALLAQLVSTQAQLARSEREKSALLVELNNLSGEVIRLRSQLPEAELQLAVLVASREMTSSATVGSDVTPQQAPRPGFLSPSELGEHQAAAARVLGRFR